MARREQDLALLWEEGVGVDVAAVRDVDLEDDARYLVREALGGSNEVLVLGKAPHWIGLPILNCATVVALSGMPRMPR